MGISMAEPCAQCGHPVSKTAARCPHCNKIQPGRGVKASPKTYREGAGPSAAEGKPLKLSQEEAAAMLQMNGLARGTSWYEVLWPRTSLPGLLGILDGVLAVLMLPLVFGMGAALYFYQGDGEGLWGRPGLLTVLALMGGLVFMGITWELDVDHWGRPLTYLAWAALAGRTQLTRFALAGSGEG